MHHADGFGQIMTSQQVSIFRLLFPPSCAFCGNDLPAWQNDRLCGGCDRVLYDPAVRHCRRCGGTLGASARDDQACALCRGTRFEFDRAIALGPYAGVLKTAVLRMKHSYEHYLACGMGELMARLMSAALHDDLPDLLVPAPMHWRRRLKRGGSSADVMSEAVGLNLGIPVANRILRCCRNTKKQSTLQPVERRKNVSNAYRALTGLDLSGMHACLVDDTLTTGATANELARLLYECGARRVTLVVAARATGSGA